MKVYVTSFCTSDDILAAEEEGFDEQGMLFPQFSDVFAEFGEREISTLKQSVVEYVNAFAEEELDVDDFKWSDSGWKDANTLDVRPNRSVVGKRPEVKVFIGVQQVDLL